MTYTATYSPEDNKLRLYASARLDPATYQRVRSAGFIWAPKQELFVAPMWTPDREDLLMDLAGEIGDEDTSLVERAEQRAERFEDYSGKRREDAERARKGVSAITEHIPLGQPILVGHHSERHARRDAERIENGMRKAVSMWETANYWTQRATGAVRAAKYKELPAVRARRIKTLEAACRKQERTAKEHSYALRFWNGELTLTHRETGATKPYAVTHANALRFLGSDPTYCSYCFPLAEYPRKSPASQYEGMMSAWSALGGSDGPDHAVATLEQIKELCMGTHRRVIHDAERWMSHYRNRLAYENAMLGEQGLAVDRTVRKSAKAQLPLCNYRQKEITVANRYSRDPMCLPQVEMTSAEYTRISPDYRCTYMADNSHRIRGAMVQGSKLVAVFLTDAKVHPKPASAEAPAVEPVRNRTVVPVEGAKPVVKAPVPAPVKPAPAPVEDDAYEQLKRSLRNGVKVVTAPQLFPTPPEIARRMVKLADVQSGECVLEPSAGTGNIVRAVHEAVDTEVLAFDINRDLCLGLQRSFPSHKTAVRCADFLTVTEFQGCYPKVLMNPPFANGTDITHIRHAMKFLAKGGKLVAICANGPRQQKELKPLADEWIELPADTFKDQGTGVRTVMLLINN